MRFKNYLTENIKENIFIKKPKDCSIDELNRYVKLISLYGDHSISKSDLKRANLLGFYYKNDEIISLCAIKNPNKSYVIDIFDAANVSNTINQEMGWALTLPNHRGKGYITKLRHEILKQVKGKVFATTRDNNIGSQKTLERQGFKQTGDLYKSLYGGNYYLRLYIR